jgi:hypothetical protein
MRANSSHATYRGGRVAILPCWSWAVFGAGMGQKPSCHAETDIYNRAVTVSSWYAQMRAQ